MYNGLDCRQPANEDTDQQWTAKFRNEIALEHKRLKSMKSSTSEYYFIQEISALESYGIEFHSVKSLAGVPLNVGVGSKELKIYDSGFNFVERWDNNIFRCANVTEAHDLIGMLFSNSQSYHEIYFSWYYLVLYLFLPNCNLWFKTSTFGKFFCQLRIPGFPKWGHKFRFGFLLIKSDTSYKRYKFLFLK